MSRISSRSGDGLEEGSSDGPYVNLHYTDEFTPEFEIRSSTALRRLQGGKSTELRSMALIWPYSSTEPSRSYRELYYETTADLYGYNTAVRVGGDLCITRQNYVILKIGKACRDTYVA